MTTTITNLDEFKSAVADFTAQAPQMNSDKLREAFEAINAAICGSLPIPPSSWPLCDQAIQAYKAACCKAN